MSEKPINLFDIDKTLTKDYIIFEIIESEQNAGLLLPTTYSNALAVRQRYAGKYLTYEQFAKSLLIEWGNGLKGQQFTDLSDHAGNWVSHNLSKFHSYAFQIFASLSDQQNWLITAEASFVAKAIADKLGATGAMGTIYTVDQGVFSGGVDRMVASRQDKAKAISELIADSTTGVNIAIGDSEADVDILALARKPICLNPSEELRIIANLRKWLVCDENNVLGYAIQNT